MANHSRSRFSLTGMTVACATLGAGGTAGAGVFFLSFDRALVIDAIDGPQGCQQSESTQAPGLFGEFLGSGCDSGITAAQQDSFIGPSSFIGGSGYARHAFGPVVLSARSSIECAFAIDCVATLEVGGQLSAASAPGGVARVRVVDERGAEVFLAEAVGEGRGDVFVNLGDTVALPAGLYHLTIEAVGSAADLPGPNIAFATFTISSVFVSGNTSCPADLNADGVVDGADLGVLLAAWRRADAGCDSTGDGTVDEADLEALLAAWGPCP